MTLPMSPTKPALPSDQKGSLLCLGLILLAISGTIVLLPFQPLNHDVTFLAWAAKQVLGPAVYGRDIYDVNPPIAFMLYVPAALLAPMTGHDTAIRLWMMLLVCLSAAGFWQSAEKALRPLLTLILVVFFLLAFPDDFAQREQMAFLLCAPYVAGQSRRRGWAILNGIMAGVGFLIKPHFLLVPLLMFALRRRLCTEDWMIGGVVLLYAASLPILFPAYLFEMVPMAMSIYWAISFPVIFTIVQAIVILLYALPIFFGSARQRTALPYFLATLGFVTAAILQGKGFFYHFIPAWGFLALYLAAITYNEKRFARRIAALFLIALGIQLGGLAYYVRSSLQSVQNTAAVIRSEVDKLSSFSSLSSHPIPVFPIAFYSSTPFLGMAMSQLAIPAVAYHQAGKGRGDPIEAERYALQQAKRELERQPDLVIVRPYLTTEMTFDSLAWLKQDPGFREMWKDYVHIRSIGNFHLYRRK